MARSGVPSKESWQGFRDNIVIIDSDEGHFEIACDEIRTANLSF